jgi:hypothetical protein
VNFEVAACLGAVVAFGLDDRYRAGSHRHARPLRRRGVVIVVGALIVLVVTQLPIWPLTGPYAALPAGTLPSRIKDAIPAGDPVAITYPYVDFPLVQPMVWQADADFQFRLLGGYAYGPGPGNVPDALPGPMRPAGLQQFLGGEEGGDGYATPKPIDPHLVSVTRAALQHYDVRLVIVDGRDPGGSTVIALFRHALGPPRVSADHISVWIRS